jgi:predicted aspartyl protease
MTRSRARTTGAVYLAYFLAAIFATFLVGRAPVAYGTYVEIAGVAAEGSLMLWLLVMGVNVQRWKDQAAKVGVLGVLLMLLTAVAASAGDAIGGTRGADAIHVTVWNHHVYVPVSVNGSRRLWFLLDTGAGVPVTLIDKDVARSAGLRTIAIKKAGAIGGNIDLALTAPAALTIGEISLKSIVFAELPLKTQEAAEGHAIDGILGYDFLRRFIVDLDYPRQLMTLSTWRVPSGVTTVRMAIEGKVPHIDSVVINRGQKASARVILDTGEDAGLLVNRAFYDTHKSFLPLSAPKIGRGLGGASKNASSEADALEIGGVSIRSIPVTVNLDTVGNLKSESDAGLIGGAVLDRLHIIFDYGNGFFSISPIRAD